MLEAKINIIGASGVGKSTLANAVAKKLRIPQFDTDHYYHLPTDPPFQKRRSPADRCSMIMNDVAHLSSWVLSGTVAGWQPEPTLKYSLVVLLYLPPEIRLERLRQRESQLFGSRILPGGDMEPDHKSFIKWSSGYDSGKCEGTNTLQHHEAFLHRETHSSLRIEGQLTTSEQLDQIINALSRERGFPSPHA